MNIPPQSCYLYFGKFSAAVDTIVLDTILKLEKQTRWSLEEFPHWFLMTVVQEVRTHTDVELSESEVSDRLEFMKLRYNTFKTVQRYDGAAWDQTNHVLNAKPELWTTILKKMSFAKAFYHRDEPEFAKIVCIFGLNDVKKEEEKEVIVLSDNTEPVSEEEPSRYVLGEIHDEVNSPVVFPPRTVRRKLIADEGEPADRESTNDVAMCFIDFAGEGKLSVRYEQGRDLAKPQRVNKPDGGTTTKSPYSYSCGSNYPPGWWPRIAQRP